MSSFFCQEMPKNASYQLAEQKHGKVTQPSLLHLSQFFSVSKFQEKIKLQLCSNCKIAEFCGKTCQEQAWKEGHKKWCLSINNPKKFHYLYQDKKYRIPKDGSGKPAAIIMDSRNCYLMSVHFKSYHGVELILSQYLNQILLGPPHLAKRYILNIGYSLKRYYK